MDELRQDVSEPPFTRPLRFSIAGLLTFTAFAAGCAPLIALALDKNLGPGLPLILSGSFLLVLLVCAFVRPIDPCGFVTAVLIVALLLTLVLPTPYVHIASRRGAYGVQLNQIALALLAFVTP
jgi:hypothetical protein